MKKLKRLMIAATSLLLAMTVGLGPIDIARHSSTPTTTVVHPALLAKLHLPSSERLSVIVAYHPGQKEAVSRAANLAGAVISAQWSFIHAFAAELPADQLLAFASTPGITLITPEQTLETSSTSLVETSHLANAYNYAVQAEQVWAEGYDGTGVTVAVVDTGVTPGTDLFVTKSVTFNSNATTPEDRYGHGTHVAGIIAGNGTGSAGKYIGIAPGVNLINVKYSSDDGSAREQDVVSALQWIYDNRNTYNIRVVNISSTVTGNPQSYRESAVAAAVEQLWFAGVVVVVSAGNKGTAACSTCYAPANDPYAISVGASDDNGTRDLSDDSVKYWSSYGATMDGHSKPEVIAPGAEITSYMPTGILRNMGFIVDSAYFRMGGTSMAAPVVTGIVALMLQKHPEWTPDQIKWVLMNTTRAYVNQPAGTAGIVQANQAVFYTDTPESANQGLLPSPFINPANGTISSTNMSWSNMSWSNMTWSNNPFY